MLCDQQTEAPSNTVWQSYWVGSKPVLWTSSLFYGYAPHSSSSSPAYCSHSTPQESSLMGQRCCAWWVKNTKHNG